MSLNDWEEVELGDVVTLHRGYDLPTSQRRNGAIPVVSSSGITGYHDEAKLDPPGVVTGRYGTLGEVFYLEVPFWPLNTTLYVSDFHGNDPRFVSYLLQCQGFGSRTNAAAVPGLNRNALHRLPIRRPPLESQYKIAALLSAHDELIENNNRRINILEEIARRIYHEWFVEFRYPGHVLPDAATPGGLPLGWRLGKLGELVAINAATIRRIDPSERIRYVDIASASMGVVQPLRTMSLGEAPGRARRRVTDGDMLWSTVRPNLRAYALMLNPGEGCVASTGFAVLSPSTASFAYIYCLTTTDEFVAYLSQRASGSAYPAVTPPVFAAAPAVVPDQSTLMTFAELAEPMLRLASRLRAQSTVLANARDLLLPGLISGEIDVSGLDIAMPPAAA